MNNTLRIEKLEEQIINLIKYIKSLQDRIQHLEKNIYEPLLPPL